jgi:hypothetical protein
MRSWKVQKFFGDVVYDLRSRGLLPVVILIAVAMVAVPVLISRGGGSSSSSAAQPTAATSSTPPEVERAVVAYAPPGVRDYKKRLSEMTAKDPFHQQFAPSAASQSQLKSTVPVQTDSGAASTSNSSPAVGAPPSSGSSGGSDTSSGTTKTGTTTTRRYYFYSVADLSVGDATQPLARHKKIKAFTPLPNQVAPVMIYLGSSVDGKRAFFSLSKSVTQVTGPGTCAPSPTDCALLVLRPGQAEDMVYSVDGKTYRVKINKINRVVTKNPPPS